ncbi:unnamed protein product [Coregonus sp. 'balchen']|nr:unnamed protein product [Coregonus sp. 'balchen']
MRQEARYLLLADALLSDMLFLLLYMVSTCPNVAGVLMSEWHPQYQGRGAGHLTDCDDSTPILHPVASLQSSLATAFYNVAPACLACKEENAPLGPKAPSSSNTSTTSCPSHAGAAGSTATMMPLTSLVVCNILLVLPKALAPYLYGLRYRDLCGAMLSFYWLKCPRPSRLSCDF